MPCPLARQRFGIASVCGSRHFLADDGHADRAEGNPRELQMLDGEGDADNADEA